MRTAPGGPGLIVSREGPAPGSRIGVFERGAGGGGVLAPTSALAAGFVAAFGDRLATRLEVG